MMRRKMVYIICCIIIIIAGLIIIEKTVLHIEDIVKENDFWIDEIQIIDMQDWLRHKITTDSYYWNKKLSNSVVNDILNNLEGYKILEIHYCVFNCSEDIGLGDIRVYFKKEYPDIVCYNSGNGDYFVPVSPMSESGLTQIVILKDKGNSDDEIIKEMMDKSVELTYYTENSGYSNGHKLVGMGIHKLQTKISDLYKSEKEQIDNIK